MAPFWRSISFHSSTSSSSRNWSTKWSLHGVSSSSCGQAKEDPHDRDKHDETMQEVGICRKLDGNNVDDVDEEDDPWNHDNMVAVTDLWKLTDLEVSWLQELGHLLRGVHHWKNDPFEVVRYVREFQNVTKAERMFRHMVAWRLQHDMDTFLDTYVPSPIFWHLPVFLCQGLDRQGDPIYVERFGVGDQYGLVVAHGGDLEPLALYTQFIREITTTRQPRRQRPTQSNRYCWQRDYYEPLMGRRLTQFTAIMDMQGLSARNMRGGLLGLLQRMARISQDCYAGMAKRIIILRAPATFQWGWDTVVKHFFDQHIRNLIVFTTPENYLEVMSRYIDLTVLPPCLAPGYGTGKAMPGYFDRVHLEGGLIPTDLDRKLDHHPGTKTRDHFEPLGNVVQSPQCHQQLDTFGSCRVSVTAELLIKGTWDTSSIHSTEASLSSLSDSIRSTSNNTEMTVYCSC